MLSNSTAAHANLPSDWLERWLPRLKTGATVLDFACGFGRNTACAVAQGMNVLAVDSDPRAVDSIAPPARGMLADLEHGPWPFSGQQFDAVVVCNYLFRPRLEMLLSLVAPGGLLIYETFMLGNEQFGRPSSAKFLLKPNELYEVSVRAGLLPVAFEQGFFESPKPAVRQRICALRAPVIPEIFRP